MPSRVRTVLILLLTIGLLWFFLRNADMAQVWAEMRRARPGQLLAAVLVTGLTYALRALRWQYVLSPLGETHFSNAFRATVIGFAATFLLPARAGEVIRPLLLARREGLPATATFATVILERLMDMVTVLSLFAVFVLTETQAARRGELDETPTCRVIVQPLILRELRRQLQLGLKEVLSQSRLIKLPPIPETG